MEARNYTKLVLTLTISFFVMYIVMFFNVAEISHVYINMTRLYMSILMVTPMALLMLFMMKKMFTDKKKNTIIIFSSVIVFISAFVLLRAQVPIKDIQYMKAMIPHHSSAILTSKNADISDPEVKKLSEKIIKSQEEEISEMKYLIEKLDN